MPRRSFYVKDSELDDYQVKIVNKRTDNSFIVKGCAGSGKSILALWKAKQIQSENRGSLLFVVFTKALKQYMADGIRQIGLNSNSVESANKCYYWEKYEDGKFVRGAWKKGMYDYIIVDEAQDFSKEEILTYKANARKALLLYGDSAQQLYGFLTEKKSVSMEEMAIITGFQTEQLVFNHRLPKKIARLAECISGINDDLEGRCQNEGVEKPYIFNCSSWQEQLRLIVSIIKNRNFVDVGILCKDNSEVLMVSNFLKENGLPNVEAKINDNIDLNFDSDNPKIMTYHSSKGLQFEAVFLPNCICDNNYRNPLYVALTRTYQTLYVFHSDNLSELFDTVPEYLYETKATTTEEL